MAVILPFLVVLALAAQGQATSIQLMVVGGDTAIPGQFPYQVSVLRLSWLFFWKHRCSGTLITKNWVLTTASCVDGGWFLRVAAGKVNLKIKEEGEQEVKVSNTILHPNFKRDGELTWEYDMALLSTSSPFQYTYYVRPVRLPVAKYETQGGALVVAGWGVYEQGGLFGWGRRWADNLQVTVVQTTSCASSNDTNLCVIDNSASTPCEGDEGGAMVQMIQDQTFTIIGMITRAPTNCKNPQVPSAAMSVFEQTKFIMDTIES